MRLLIYRVAFLCVSIGIWQTISAAEIFNPLIVSSPEAVAEYLVEGFGNGEILSNFWSTLQATLIAFVASAIVGTTIGVWLALMPRVEAVLDPFISALNAMPRIALAPVFIIYFGVGTLAKVALAFSFVTFLFILNSRAGVMSADVDILRLSRAFGASRFKLLRKVLLPTAVPSIFAAMQLGIVYSFLAVITSELIAAREGLGLLIALYSGQFEIGKVYGILVVLAVVASAFNVGIGVVERRLLRWREPLR